jgi:hypothetical protein
MALPAVPSRNELLTFEGIGEFQTTFRMTEIPFFPEDGYMVARTSKPDVQQLTFDPICWDKR